MGKLSYVFGGFLIFALGAMTYSASNTSKSIIQRDITKDGIVDIIADAGAKNHYFIGKEDGTFVRTEWRWYGKDGTYILDEDGSWVYLGNENKFIYRIKKEK